MQQKPRVLLHNEHLVTSKDLRHLLGSSAGTGWLFGAWTLWRSVLGPSCPASSTKLLLPANNMEELPWASSLWARQRSDKFKLQVEMRLKNGTSSRGQKPIHLNSLMFRYFCDIVQGVV